MVDIFSLSPKPKLVPSNSANTFLPMHLVSTDPVNMSLYKLALSIDYTPRHLWAEQRALSEAGTDTEGRNPDTPGYGELTTVGGQVASLFTEPSTPNMVTNARRSTGGVDTPESFKDVSPASLRVEGHAIGDGDSPRQRGHYTTTSTPRVSEGFSTGGPRRPKIAASELQTCNSDISVHP